MTSGSNKHRKKHWVTWSTENISVHQLPSKLLLSIFLGVQSVVTVDITMQSSHNDHSNHSSQEQNDNKWIHNWEPLDVGVWHWLENVIPSGRPLDISFRPLDTVGICDFGTLGFCINGDWLRWITAVQARWRAMFNGAWLNVNTDDSSSNFVLQEVSIIGHISVVDLNVNMIEDVEVVRSLVFLLKNKRDIVLKNQHFYKWIFNNVFCRTRTTFWKRNGKEWLIEVSILDKRKFHEFNKKLSKTYIEYTSVMLISLLINKTSNWESSSAYIHILKILETESHWHVVNNPMMLVVKCHGSLEQSKLCQIIGASTSVFLCVANQTAFFFLQECHLIQSNGFFHLFFNYVTLYGLGRIRSPNKTCPRFSTGDSSSFTVQKSKLKITSYFINNHILSCCDPPMIFIWDDGAIAVKMIDIQGDVALKFFSWYFLTEFSKYFLNHHKNLLDNSLFPLHKSSLVPGQEGRKHWHWQETKPKVVLWASSSFWALPENWYQQKVPWKTCKMKEKTRWNETIRVSLHKSKCHAKLTRQPTSLASLQCVHSFGGGSRNDMTTECGFTASL